MAVRQKDLKSPIPLRAHRPRHADTQTPLPADVQESYQVVTEDLPKHTHWIRQNLHYFGFGMLLMLALWYAGTSYVVPFVQEKIDHWNCGAPPGICQFDLNVGHGGTTHFLTQYWHSQVILIETPLTDPGKTKVYSAPVSVIGGDSSQRIVTLTTAYIARHPQKGKPDIVASVTGFSLPIIFYNTGNGFST